MDLYSQFVEKWREQFPQDVPPLIDMQGCTEVNKEFETISYSKIQKLYTNAKQTSEALRKELRKAEFIEQFFEDLISHGHETSNVPDSAVASETNDSRGRYSLIQGMSKCVDFSLETLVNIGCGQDAIDITENHEIQINSVVGKNLSSVAAEEKDCYQERPADNDKLYDNNISGFSETENVPLSAKDNRVSGMGGGVGQETSDSDGPMSEYGGLGEENKHLPNDQSQSQLDQVDGRGGRNGKNDTPATCERVPSVKPAVPPRKKIPSSVAKPKPVITPRLNDHNVNKILQQSAGEPERSHRKKDKSFSPVAQYRAPRSTSPSAESGSQESETQSETANSDNVSFERKLKVSDQTSCPGDQTDESLNFDDSEDNMKRFKLGSNARGDKRTNSDVIVKGYRKKSDASITGPVNATDPVETQQEVDLDRAGSPNYSSEKAEKQKPVSKDESKGKHSRSGSRSDRMPNYENISLDFLVTCMHKRPSIGTDDFELSLDEHEVKKGDKKESSESVPTSDSSDVPAISIDNANCVTEEQSTQLDGHSAQEEVTSADFPSSPSLSESSTSSPVIKKFGEHNNRQSLDVRSEDEDCHSADSHDENEITWRTSSEIKKLKSDKLHLRKILVKGILESEKTYLSILKDITELKRSIQNKVTDMWTRNNRICSMEDVTTIFCHVEELHKKHQDFVKNLQEKVDNWSDSQEIGMTFKEMIVYFPLYMKFVNNTQKAQDCLQKCCQENSEFKKLVTHMKISSPSPNKDAITLQEALFMPVQRLQRNTLVLHDLLKSTPEDHPDFKTLQKTLDLADHNLKNFAFTEKSIIHTSEDSAPLVKSGFVVEVVRHSRKLRYLFLFSDVIVCTKHKQNRNRVNSFEVKWYIPMQDILLDSKYEKSFTIKEDTESMKKKIVSLKAELRQEMKNHAELVKDRSWSLAGKVSARTIDKLKKKIEEQEAALVLASPHLPLQLRVTDDSQNPIILLSTDYEREEWRDAILSQQKHHHGGLQRQLSGHDIQSKINESKQLPQVNNIGTVLTKKDEEMLNGSLNVTIHKLHGVEGQWDTYVELHLDSFGHFFIQAKTRLCPSGVEATWDEDFELELDGSQTLRILCYKKCEGEDILIGRSALELSKQWLGNKFQEQKVPMNDLSLTISVRHTPTNKTLKRTPSKLQGGIFGYKISTVTNRERKTVSTFVSSCIKEVESRGLKELGIYRVSGVTSEVQRIKKAFDKNIRSGLNLLSETDIHAVTGVFKLYLRELPEPLFTQANYKQFIDAVGLHDEYSKEKVFLQLIHELPDANYYTIVAIVEHLVRVSKHEEENKMSISNLATIFGPTLLHPAITDTQTPEQLMQDAQDVFIQAAVLSFLLQLAAKGKSIRRSEVAIELSGQDMLV